MSQSKKEPPYRIVYSSGGEFYTSATTVAEYVLDPVFIQFMAMCVIMFTALMLATGLPPIPQVILFGAGIMSTFLFLSIILTLYLAVLKLFGGRTLYTLLLLLPMQMMNTVVIEYVLRQFGSSHVDGFTNIWEVAIRTVIVIVCLDIFHGKYVAHMHGKAIAAPGSEPEPFSGQNASLGLASLPAEQVSVQSDVNSIDLSSERVQMPMAEPIETVQTVVAPVKREATTDPNRIFKIANSSFDIAAIQFIRSEDHYLFVQQEQDSKMVRGKLRDVSAEIDVKWGLQINRSVWVAYSFIMDVEDGVNGQLQAKLKDGSTLRVAESRRVFFLHSFKTYGSQGGGSPIQKNGSEG